MLTKSRVKEQIDLLPDEFSIDELVDRLILIEKIARGERQSVENETISDDQLEIEMEKWFK
jgi:hypothetical protein